MPLRYQFHWSGDVGGASRDELMKGFLERLGETIRDELNVLSSAYQCLRDDSRIRLEERVLYTHSGPEVSREASRGKAGVSTPMGFMRRLPA